MKLKIIKIFNNNSIAALSDELGDIILTGSGRNPIRIPLLGGQIVTYPRIPDVRKNRTLAPILINM